MTSYGQKRSKAATRVLASRHGVPQPSRDSRSAPLEKHPEKCWTSKDYILWPSHRNDQDPGDVPTTVGVNRTKSGLRSTSRRCPHNCGGEPRGKSKQTGAEVGCPHNCGGEPRITGGIYTYTARCLHNCGGEPNMNCSFVWSVTDVPTTVGLNRYDPKCMAPLIYFSLPQHVGWTRIRGSLHSEGKWTATVLHAVQQVQPRNVRR